MKKIILVFAFLMMVVSGCGKASEESSVPSSENPETKAEESKSQKFPKNQESQESQESQGTPEAPKTREASVKAEGIWRAAGKEDGVTSTWFFQDGHLVVNHVNDFSYTVAENKDAKGYTAVTIENQQGRKHALLFKENGAHLEGITAEDEAYDQYLADGTVPDGQVIEFTPQPNGWGSMDEAIDFWEKTYKNPDNKISESILWGNYRRNLWSLVEGGTSENTMTLHFANISGAGGSYVELIKNEEFTVITDFDGNASYPHDPSMRYTVQQKNHKVIKTEELWKQ
ncbi:hypothetical protein [Bacillus massiliglaciei]|uniref:hypothetical protein n=1 Tax=Bacillus massiliglaciei TaxID=1816693 RepID=UPI000B0F4AC8|nr:hypothetical protein [Bacillus massiliglaciei]